MAQLFDAEFFQQLQNQAQQSPRKRSNTNLHQDYNDVVQRMFITLEHDSYVKPHQHSSSEKWECFLMVQGQVAFLIFDDNGYLKHRHILDASGPNKGIEIEPFTWHSVVALTKQATFFEVKQGPYTQPQDKDFSTWAPNEGEPEVPEFLDKLRQLQPGQSIKHG